MELNVGDEVLIGKELRKVRQPWGKFKLVPQSLGYAIKVKITRYEERKTSLREGAKSYHRGFVALPVESDDTWEFYIDSNCLLTYEDAKDVRTTPSTRHKRGQSHHKAVLCEQDVLEIKRLLVEGEYNQTKIAGMFGVSQAQINHIKTGKRWAHIK